MRTCTLESNEKEKRLPSVEEFVFYMVTRSYTTAEELIMCAVYLSRFQKRLPPAGATMRPSTPHRIFLAALILAHKVHNDDSVNNACWAGCSASHECDFDGFSNMEVNRIEKRFLALIEWEIHISAGQYEKQCLAFIDWRIHTSASRYGRFSQDAYTTYSNPPKSVDTKPCWTCSCCICIEWWTNSAQGLWHCFNCFTPGETEVEMQGGLPSIEQSHVLQHPFVDQPSILPPVASLGHDTLGKSRGTPPTNNLATSITCSEQTLGISFRARSVTLGGVVGVPQSIPRHITRMEMPHMAK